MSGSVMLRPAGFSACWPPLWGTAPCSTHVRAVPARCTISCWDSTWTLPCPSLPSATSWARPLWMRRLMLLQVLISHLSAKNGQIWWSLCEDPLPKTERLLQTKKSCLFSYIQTSLYCMNYNCDIIKIFVWCC